MKHKGIGYFKWGIYAIEYFGYGTTKEMWKNLNIEEYFAQSKEYKGATRVEQLPPAQNHTNLYPKS